MKAARIHEHGGPDVLRVEEVSDPEPGPRDVLVRQTGTSVNHRDIWLRKGLPDATFQLPLPHILGMDISGEVVAVGPEVGSVHIGDRVIANPYVACGQCHACRRQRPHHCARIDEANGGYAELAVVPEDRAIRIADSVPEVYASSFPNTYITAWEMLVEKARVTPDDTVFTWGGTSGLGSAVIDIAKLVGCTVISTAGHEGKLKVLAGLEPDLVLNHHQDDVVAEVMEFTSGAGASVIVEHVGTATWQRTVELAASGARIISAGLTSGRTLEMDVVTMIMKQFSVTGSTLGTMASARAVADQLSKGRLQPLIGRTIPLDSIAQAHETLEGGGTVGKVLIDLTAGQGRQESDGPK